MNLDDRLRRLEKKATMRWRGAGQVAMTALDCAQMDASIPNPDPAGRQRQVAEVDHPENHVSSFD